MKATVSNYGLMYSPTVMGGLVSLEPFEVIAKAVGPCNCGFEEPDSPRMGHASSCPTQYAMIEVQGHTIVVYLPNIEIMEEVTA